MSRLLIILITLSVYIVSVYSLELKENLDENSSLLNVEGRRRKGHYFLYPYYGWHALSWVYWVKVKLIVVAFFVGTAFIWGIQFLAKYYQKCPDVGHIHYGHHRSFEDSQVPKILQNLKQFRKRRSLRHRY